MNGLGEAYPWVALQIGAVRLEKVRQAIVEGQLRRELEEGEVEVAPSTDTQPVVYRAEVQQFARARPELQGSIATSSDEGAVIAPAHGCPLQLQW